MATQLMVALLSWRHAERRNDLQWLVPRLRCSSWHGVKWADMPGWAQEGMIRVMQEDGGFRSATGSKRLPELWDFAGVVKETTRDGVNLYQVPGLKQWAAVKRTPKHFIIILCENGQQEQRRVSRYSDAKGAALLFLYRRWLKLEYRRIHGPDGPQIDFDKYGPGKTEVAK